MIDKVKRKRYLRVVVDSGYIHLYEKAIENLLTNLKIFYEFDTMKQLDKMVTEVFTLEDLIITEENLENYTELCYKYLGNDEDVHNLKNDLKDFYGLEPKIQESKEGWWNNYV